MASTHGMPLADNATISATAWELHRVTITDLYMQRHLTLSQVMEIMKDRYGFRATSTMYKKQFQKWSLRKNITKSEALALMKVSDARRSAGKQTEARLGRKMIDLSKLARQFPSEASLEASEVGIELADIVVRTPSPPNPSIQRPWPHESIERVFHSLKAYMEISLNSGQWQMRYNATFWVKSSQDQSDISLNNARRLFELSKKLLDQHAFSTVDPAFRVLSTTLDKMPSVLEHGSPMLVPAILEMYQTVLNYKGVLDEVRNHFKRLAHVILGASHPLHLLLDDLVRLQDSDLVELSVPVYDLLLDYLVPRIGPDNILAARLYLGRIWQTRDCRELEDGTIPPIVKKYMTAVDDQASFYCTKTSFALFICKSHGHKEGIIAADTSLTEIMANQGLLLSLSEFSSILSKLVLGMLKYVGGNRNEARALFDTAIESSEKWNWHLPLKKSAHACLKSAEDSYSIQTTANSTRMIDLYSNLATTVADRIGPQQDPRNPQLPSPDAYKIAIFCASPLESDYLCVLLDRVHDSIGLDRSSFLQGNCTYTLGEIGRHCVVIVTLPRSDITRVSDIVEETRRGFPNIGFALSVGFCGAPPHDLDGNEIYLGDIILSHSVTRYDQWRTSTTKPMTRHPFHVGLLQGLGIDTQVLISSLEATGQQRALQRDLQAYMLRLECAKEEVRYPGVERDYLYDTKSLHKHHAFVASDTCGECSLHAKATCELALRCSCNDLNCDQYSKITRLRPKSSLIHDQQTKIHFGKVGGGSCPPESGSIRDRLKREYSIIAFEQDASAIHEAFPTLSIKGVSSYADGHHDDVWQPYGAAIAASVTCAILKGIASSGGRSHSLGDRVEGEQHDILFHTGSQFEHTHVSPPSTNMTGSLNIQSGTPLVEADSLHESSYLSSLQELAVKYKRIGLQAEAKKMIELVIHFRGAKLGWSDINTKQALDLYDSI